MLTGEFFREYPLADLACPLTEFLFTLILYVPSDALLVSTRAGDLQDIQGNLPSLPHLETSPVTYHMCRKHAQPKTRGMDIVDLFPVQSNSPLRLFSSVFYSHVVCAQLIPGR